MPSVGATSNPILPSDRNALAPVSHPESAGDPEFSSRELLRGARAVLIRHGEQVYRLRHTRNDKLILTK